MGRIEVASASIQPAAECATTASAVGRIRAHLSRNGGRLGLEGRATCVLLRSVGTMHHLLFRDRRSQWLVLVQADGGCSMGCFVWCDETVPFASAVPDAFRAILAGDDALDTRLASFVVDVHGARFVRLPREVGRLQWRGFSACALFCDPGRV